MKLRIGSEIKISRAPHTYRRSIETAALSNKIFIFKDSMG
jgi:hypothetical protein